MATTDRIDHEAWPLRAALLAGLGALFGIALDLTLKEGPQRWTEAPLRLALASFLAVGGFSFAFTLERMRWRWSVWFGLGCGLIVALVFFWNGSPDGWSTGDGWRIAAALLAVALAAPLFQFYRDRGRWVSEPAEVHAHAWTNLVLWFAAWAFVLVSWLLAQLLAELFQLIGIRLLREALQESWVNLALVGAALGGAIGLLRDRDKVLGLLQRVVTTILSVLAPALAVGLVLFVLALPFTGLETLWETTRDTTPILLSAVGGALVLVNAVIGNGPEEEAQAKVLRWSAVALGLVIAPLALVAAISTWLRVDQYGFTPERLWALTFVLVALAVAGSYGWAVLRGRVRWPDRVRNTNLKLAIGICGIALLLATPAVDFGAMSARDQLARLEAGKVSPEEFDWAALRFDFGPAGRRALERLARMGPEPLRARSREALAATERWVLEEQGHAGRATARLAGSLRVLPRPVALPVSLRAALAAQNICRFGPCTLVWPQGAREAVAVAFPCEQCQATVTRFQLDPKGNWQTLPMPGIDRTGGSPVSIEAQRRAVAQAQVELRPVQRRQVFVAGRPVGPALE